MGFLVWFLRFFTPVAMETLTNPYKKVGNGFAEWADFTMELFRMTNSIILTSKNTRLCSGPPASCNTFRPCYTRRFSRVMATQQTLHCRFLRKLRVWHTPATQQNIALQVAEKVDCISTFGNVAKTIALCDILLQLATQWLPWVSQSACSFHAGNRCNF